MIATVVNFDEAKLLATADMDVMVFDPLSGDVFRFNDPTWRYRGVRKTLDQILDELGYPGMDDKFGYVWLHWPVT